MWGLDEIIAMNKKKALAKAKFLANAMNNPKDWKEQKTKLGGVPRQKPKDFYGTNL